MEILTLFKTAAKMIFQLSWILSKAMVLLIVSLQVPFAKASQQHQQKIIWNLTHLAWSSTLVVRRCLSFGVSHHTSKSDFFYYLFYQVRLFFTIHFIKSFLFAHMLVWAITPLNICVSTDFLFKDFDLINFSSL